MKCDRCGKEATVHDIKLVQGKFASHVHLCEECAFQQGKVGPKFQSLGELVHESIAKQAGLSPSRRRAHGVCPECGLAWNEFRERGLLGCPACYDAFEEQIGPLLERAHERGTHHVGKRPTEVSGEADRQIQVRHLREKLAQAIALEQYEEAASLRDELTGLGVSLRGHESVEEAGGP